jgi:hypothetical protein
VRKLNHTEWLKITSDLWILDTVKSGYKIEFNPVPDFSGFLLEIHFEEDEDIRSRPVRTLGLSSLNQSFGFYKYLHAFQNLFSIPLQF